MSGADVLRVEGLAYRYGKTEVFAGASFSLRAGEVAFLTGSNGAGKSTLLGLIANRLVPTSGRIFVDDEPAADNARALAKLYCMNDKKMYPENLRLDNLFKEMGRFYEGFDRTAAAGFAEAFGLHVAGVIATEPGEEPSTRDIADTCDLVNTLGIRTLFVEPQYPQKVAQTIARETGASIYTLDPCVSGDGSMESYENIMRENARVLTEAFAQ